MNLRNYKQKAAISTISGLGGEHKFHFTPIPKTWCKMDVRVALVGDVAFMFPNEDVEQMRVKDAIGSSAIWSTEFGKGTCSLRSEWLFSLSVYDMQLFQC